MLTFQRDLAQQVLHADSALRNNPPRSGDKPQ
jgi:hypothetical protein